MSLAISDCHVEWEGESGIVILADSARTSAQVQEGTSLQHFSVGYSNQTPFPGPGLSANAELLKLCCR